MEQKPHSKIVDLRAVAPRPLPRPAPQYYVGIDAAGDVTAFYDVRINGASIPADALPITSAQYRQWHDGQCSNPAIRHKFIGGRLVAPAPAECKRD